MQSSRCNQNANSVTYNDKCNGCQTNQILGFADELVLCLWTVSWKGKPKVSRKETWRARQAGRECYRMGFTDCQALLCQDTLPQCNSGENPTHIFGVTERHSHWPDSSFLKAEHITSV